jgi:hypothetical protein
MRLSSKADESDPRYQARLSSVSMLASLNIGRRGRIEQIFLPLLILLDCLTAPFTEKYHRDTNQIGSPGRASRPMSYFQNFQ